MPAGADFKKILAARWQWAFLHMEILGYFHMSSLLIFQNIISKSKLNFCVRICMRKTWIELLLNKHEITFYEEEYHLSAMRAFLTAFFSVSWRFLSCLETSAMEASAAFCIWSPCFCLLFFFCNLCAVSHLFFTSLRNFLYLKKDNIENFTFLNL